MAKQTLNIIKNWFRTGLKPTQNQFWDTWDSFWHKDEKIPTNAIENLDFRFDEKADQGAFQSHLNDVDAHSELLATKANLIGGNTFMGAQQITGDDTLLALDSQQLKVLDLANSLSTTITPNGISWEAEGQAYEYTFPTTSGTLALADDIGNFIKPIEVTYADLVDLINSSSLVANQKYLITDFQTIHTIPNSSPAELNTGPVEPLIIKASGVNSIYSEVKSTLYPQDILKYKIDNENGSTKGTIVYREDTIQKNILFYDFRHYKIRRWKLNPPTWTNIGFTIGNSVQLNNAIYHCVATHGTGQNPETETQYWKKIIDDNTNYLSHTSANFSLTLSASTSGNLLIPTNINDYIDTVTFPNYTNIKGNTIGMRPSIIANIVVYTDGQPFGFVNNTITHHTATSFSLRGTYYCYDNYFRILQTALIVGNNQGTASTNIAMLQNNIDTAFSVLFGGGSFYYNNINQIQQCVLQGTYRLNSGQRLAYLMGPSTFNSNNFKTIGPVKFTNTNHQILGCNFNCNIGIFYANSFSGNARTWTVTANLIDKTFTGSIISDTDSPNAMTDALTKSVIYAGLPTPIDVNDKEDMANKATNLISPDNIKYPTTQAVATGLSEKANLGTSNTFTGDQIITAGKLRVNTNREDKYDMPIVTNGINIGGTAFFSDGNGGLQIDDEYQAAPLYRLNGGSIDLLAGGHIYHVFDPINSDDAANKQYVDNIAAGIPQIKYGSLLVTFNGGDTVFNIPHGMTGITASSSFALTFGDASNSTFIQSVRTLTATHIVITCNTAPAAGSQTVYWQVFK